MSRWEVRELLGAVADDLEAAVSEVERLRSELASLGVRLSEIRTQDREATRLLSQAEADARLIREKGEREAAEVIARAEARAQAMLQEVEAERQLLAARIEQCEERQRRVATVLQDEVNDLREFLAAEPVPVVPPADPAPVAALETENIEPELPVEQLDEDSTWSAADVQRALAAVTGVRIETGEAFDDEDDRANDPFGVRPSSNETTSSKTLVAARLGRLLSRKWLVAAGAAAAVILTIVASRGDSPVPPDIKAAGLHRASKSARPSPAPAPAESAEQNPSPAPAPATEAVPPIPDGAMRVKIEAVRPCWIRLTANGRSEERVLQAGEALIRDSQTDVVLRAGNAGALVVTQNGRTLPPLGREGEIVTRRLPHTAASTER